ncbi:ADP/ATP carrier protein [Vairimorpha necatrix]|uniref:ADP,ATP carrier protein n=1 Tax=Vairimorpha necatrix TaxID=6039 RepID=A0AAX4JDK2_9MICR
MDVPNDNPQNTLPTEDEIEQIANSRTGLLSYFKVARVEFPKFFILGIMFGLINFIYSFMRILKDLFVMVRQDQNSIMFMKIFYVLPISFASIVLIQWLMQNRSVSSIFNLFLITFTAFFFGLGVVFLYEKTLLPSGFKFKDVFADHKGGMRGLNVLKYFLITANEPVSTIIFIVAEMWGSLLMAYLFMSFLNESCTIRQFTRFLPPFYIIANLALLISGLVSSQFRELRKGFTYAQNQVLYSSIFIILGSICLVLLYMKFYFETKVNAIPIFLSSNTIKKKQKVSVGFQEGISIMMKSKLLMSLCIIVFFYNITFNLIESVYKAGIKAASKTLGLEVGEYSAKFNTIDQILVAVTVITLNLSAFSTLIETSGWITMGLLTPLMTLLGTIIVLGASIYNSGKEGLAFSWISSVFKHASYIYSIENYSGMFFLAFIKILKYSAFDICKEKMGMRIDPAHRARFKSVYDGIFNKLGKSIGSLYGLGVLVALDTDNVRKASPFTLIISLLLIYIWIRAVIYLSRAYNESIKNNSDVDIDLKKESKKLEAE